MKALLLILLPFFGFAQQIKRSLVEPKNGLIDEKFGKTIYRYTTEIKPGVIYRFPEGSHLFSMDDLGHKGGIDVLFRDGGKMYSWHNKEYFYVEARQMLDGKTYPILYGDEYWQLSDASHEIAAIQSTELGRFNLTWFTLKPVKSAFWLNNTK